MSETAPPRTSAAAQAWAWTRGQGAYHLAAKVDSPACPHPFMCTSVPFPPCCTCRSLKNWNVSFCPQSCLQCDVAWHVCICLCIISNRHVSLQARLKTQHIKTQYIKLSCCLLLLYCCGRVTVVSQSLPKINTSWVVACCHSFRNMPSFGPPCCC